ncbi:hypothetical protein [Desulfogranum japonicum]|uniref:hypothetical protein n=1 Tax=Desulfogranum japonicum TaxID=231447 RepID=UPI0004036F49|nr:hypothetical protein [Desulfogranum japonicum]
MNVIVMLMVIGCAIWVYYDATTLGIKRGNTSGFFNLGPLGWAVCVLMIWIIAFPLYLFKRGDLKDDSDWDYDEIENDEKPSAINRTAKFIAIGWTILCFIGVIIGLVAVGEQTYGMTNEYELAGASIGATIGIGIWFMIWAFLTVPATIIYFLTRKTVVTVRDTVVSGNRKISGATKKCPFCAETIKKDAIFCRFCKKDISKRKDPQVIHNVSPPVLPKKTINVTDLVATAKQHIKKEAYNEAVDAASKAIDGDSENGEAYFLRAAAFSKLKNKQRMLADLKVSAALGNELAHKNLAKLKVA